MSTIASSATFVQPPLRAASSPIVTSDRLQPPPEAYAAGVRFCADDNEWDRAADLYREWSTWAASASMLSDQRISAWQVRIYHRGYAGADAA